MTAKMKQWVAIAVVAALVILAGGWFLLVSPKRSHAADLRNQASAKQRANAMLMSDIAALKAQAKDLPKQQAKLAAVAAKIPNNSAMPALVRSLTAAADDAGVELVSLTPTPAAPLTPLAAGTSSTTATAAAPSAAAASAGLAQIGVTINVVGSYFQVAEYLDRLEGLTRAFRVSGFTLNPGTNPVKSATSQPSVDTGKVLTAAITGQVFQTTGTVTPSLTSGK